MKSYQSPNNNYKAAFEISPTGACDTQIRLKENNLWNDSFVKVVNQTSVVLADSTMQLENSPTKSSASSLYGMDMVTGKVQPCIRSDDIKEISSSNNTSPNMREE